MTAVDPTVLANLDTNTDRSLPVEAYVSDDNVSAWLSDVQLAKLPRRERA